MKKLIGRFKRSKESPLLVPTSGSPGSVAGPSSTLTGVDASVHDNSHGHTYIIQGNNNTFSHGTNMFQKINKPVNERIEKLNRSCNAEYDMTVNAARGPCTPETRTIILDSLEEWRKLGKQPIFWLNGMAGTGKTTIAYSASKRWDETNHLGASFFCSRGVPDCREILLLLTTVAVELSARYPVFGEALEEALSKDKDIQRRDFGVQLRKLIIDPWNACNSNLPDDLVVVIDALDECENDQFKFLQTLFDNASCLPFKILVTSRPEYEIRTAIMARNSRTRDICVLHEVEKDMVQADIVKFLENELRHYPYATPDIINSIAELADSFFIYASTLAKLVIGGRVNISKCLEALKRSSLHRVSDKSNLMAALDGLYREVLTRVLTDTPLEDGAQEIKEVLYTVICAREPMNRRALAEMWNLEGVELSRRLDLLRSVLFVSEHNDDFPITTFHASFPDFLLDESRSREFFCRPQRFNSIILGQCLALMNNKLHQNMCHVDGRPPNDLVNTQAIKALGPGVRYASLYWAEHFVYSGDSEQQDYSGSIADFLAKHSLHWFEYLSLEQRLVSSLHSLEGLESKTNKNTTLGAVAYEYLRFIQQMYDPIEYSAMEAYASALAWVPQDSLLRTYHAPLFSNTPRVLCGLPLTWSGPERVISIHSGDVKCLAVSQDGGRLISGSWDNTVRVSNLRKQAVECVFTGHTDWVQSVALHKDQNLIASGSYDKTIRVWDLSKCEPILTMTTTYQVKAVDISPDGKWIVSGHNDTVIHVWDRTNGQLVHSLRGHKGLVQSLAFMTNGTTFISASEDGTVRVWDVLTGQKKSVLCVHANPIWSVACSPVEDVIATATGRDDGTAHLWDALGMELQVFKGHTGYVLHVDFLPDGKRIVTGSHDSTVRIWNVSSGELVYVFLAPRPINSIAVFGDGTKIAASFGRDVGIWDVKGVKIGGRADLTGHGSPPINQVEGMVFSSDGHRVLLLPMLKILDTATLEEWVTRLPHDGTYRKGALNKSGRLVASSEWFSKVISVWELGEDGTVAEHFALTGHTRSINSLSFSYDGNHLASTSEDNTARIWDLTTRQQTHSLSHTSDVLHAVFSHDGRRIASMAGPFSYATLIWDTQSGRQLHQWEVLASHIAFTHDDHHLICSDPDYIRILNTQTLEQEYEYASHECWTTLQDGSSYAFNRDGWIYYFASIGAQPRKALWVPSSFRPTLEVPPLVLSSPEAHIYLPRRDGLITTQIPCDY